MDPPTNLETSGFVSSRFVSQTEIDQAAQRKQEEWKAAYARLGQEPPPQETEGEYDPRSLYEFRGLESDELQFLDEVAREEREKQRRVERQDAEELALFKARQSKTSLIGPPPVETNQQRASSSATSVSTTAPNTKPAGTTATNSTSVPRSGNKVKSLLKGVIRKKDTSAATQQKAISATVKGKPQSPTEIAIQNGSGDETQEPSGKRKRPSQSITSAAVQDVKVPAKTTTTTTLPPALGVLGGYSSESDDDEQDDARIQDEKSSLAEGDIAKKARLA
ncbi:hypothetical protein QFC24_005066 [Naganishia onofrii]|uniref:Uncharacterized protein n=1 Tax=Naganishia onofrii TaxID=1851511 RepID=A0ACC2XBT9_9TREE|nr:hypothetical protein QFC24_005066 [Naganishia onofrii]